MSSSLQQGSAWAAYCARKASPRTVFIQPPGLGGGREASTGCARVALLSLLGSFLAQRCALPSFFTQLLEQGLRSFQTMHCSEPGEGVLVVSQSADDQLLAGDEKRRREVRTSEMNLPTSAYT